jgi:hypothetical protein
MSIALGKDKGNNVVDVRWTGARGTYIVINRQNQDATPVFRSWTVLNNGYWRDTELPKGNIISKNSRPYSYSICEQSAALTDWQCNGGVILR